MLVRPNPPKAEKAESRKTEVNSEQLAVRRQKLNCSAFSDPFLQYKWNFCVKNFRSLGGNLAKVPWFLRETKEIPKKSVFFFGSFLLVVQKK